MKNDINCVDYTKTDIKSNDVSLLINTAEYYHNSKQYKEALAYYFRSAELESAAAMDMVGVYYRDGLYVKKDTAKAAKWFNRAIEKNFRCSYCNLGMLYNKGDGVEKNINRAIELLQHASDLQLGVASHNLATIYHLNNDFRDVSKAAYYYKLAIEQGYSSATTLNNLATLYMNGEGVELDYNKAQELLEKAVRLNGSKIECDNIKELKERKHVYLELFWRWTVCAFCILFAGCIFFSSFSSGGFFAGLLISVALIVIAIIAIGTRTNSAIKVENEFINRKMRERQEREIRLTRTCPRCGKHAGHPISEHRKTASIAFWGLASNKIGKTYECDNCHYMW